MSILPGQWRVILAFHATFHHAVLWTHFTCFGHVALVVFGKWTKIFSFVKISHHTRLGIFFNFGFVGWCGLDCVIHTSTLKYIL